MASFPKRYLLFLNWISALKYHIAMIWVFTDESLMCADGL